MPGPTQVALALIAALTGALPAAAGAVIVAADGDLAGAAACVAVAGLIALPLPLRRSRWFRMACLVAGLPLLAIALGGLAFGGILVLPTSLALVAAGATPRAWPLWKGLAAPVAAIAIAFGVLVGGAYAYTCLQPVPLLVVVTAEPYADIESQISELDGVAFSATGDGYQWAFPRGAGDERDEAAARLRNRAGVESVRTRDERCG